MNQDHTLTNDYELSISIIIHTIRFGSIKHLTYPIILDINIYIFTLNII